MFVREPQQTTCTTRLLLLIGLLLLFLLSIYDIEPALARHDSFQEVKTAKMNLAISSLKQDEEPLLMTTRLAGVPTVQAVLVRATDLSQLSPPSPDSSGIAYLPQFNALLISDGEVNELPIFTGDNLFLTSLGGNLRDTLTTISFSDEPTDVAYNPANHHLFFTDDTGNQRVFEMNPGPDGDYDTADDIITYFNTPAFGSMDPEGLTFDSSQGDLLLVDGFNEEVYEIDPGLNGIFDGVPPTGDDLVSHFDVTSFGITDPEGIEFNPVTGHLYILSSRDNVIAETKRDGTLIRYIGLAALDILKPAGLAYAPARGQPTIKHLYIVSRGVDNDSDPDENDGMLYEISVPNIVPQLFFPVIRR